MKEEIKRNIKMYKQKTEKGMTYSQLGLLHKVTPGRAFIIIKDIKIKIALGIIKL